MMKKLVLLVAFIAVVIGGSTALSHSADERESVRQAVLDYVEGVYQVEPARIERSVHPSLSKHGYWREKGKDTYTTGKMSFAELVEVAKNWNKSGKLPKDAPKEITIFDVQDQTASAKLVAAWGTDYFHLAKYEGKWMIVNVLWQSPPPKSSEPALR